MPRRRILLPVVGGLSERVRGGLAVVGIFGVLLFMALGLSACGGSTPAAESPTGDQGAASGSKTSEESRATAAGEEVEEVSLPKLLPFAPPECPVDTAQVSQLMDEPMAVDPAMTSGGSCQFTAEAGSDYLLIAWTEPAAKGVNGEELRGERSASIASGLKPTTPPGLGPGAVESHGFSEDGSYQSIIYWELDQRVVDVIVQGSPESEQQVDEAASYLVHALSP